ncbi:hypothetical protein CEUSTIGMA_g9218.t1 [Chlamydomonas eustigma]|uniref:Pyruvate kinase C-terminal domain-containing protein n=1 Tax=Chlamydomonas eustigma TaxID=1157962 RepID=A0A250XG73_9CHLO|nr:hypothetical protein CEUSTIGMA_g9218.t1 [Chlamydomonas eustigma]|eukprot:GAX81790.1 hypothetical protein CEUSTIGMA_g9218.t1 [Chlamydomonas eustigma]
MGLVPEPLYISRAAESVFDHSSHYEYLMEAAWEAVEEMHNGGHKVHELPEEPNESIATQMLINGVPQDGPGFRSASMNKRGSFSTAVHAMAKYSMAASHANLVGMTAAQAHQQSPVNKTPYLSKLEAIASSAVRAADKVQAKLIVVYTHTGQTAELVAKYRPPMPILTMVVPHLVSDGLKWKLEGRAFARQSLICRGLLPFLAAPSPNGEQLLEDAIQSASRLGLVRGGDHVVVVQRVQEDFCIKIVAVNDKSTGVLRNSGSIGNMGNLED